MIICEMGRIASHLVGMGAYGLDLGTFSPFLYAFREREKILDLFEEACGARLTYSYLTVGGATADLPPRLAAEVRGVSRPVRADHRRNITRCSRPTRSSSSGPPASASCSPEMAIDFGTSGPVLRGSGVDHDLRRDGEEIYTSMYDGYAFEVICERTATTRTITTIPPCRTKRCSAIVGTGSTCGCSKSCRAIDLCGRRSTATARRPAATASR